MNDVLFHVPRTLVPVVGNTGKKYFPVRRIYCLGQNYHSVAKATECVSTKAFPYFFTKPTDSLVTDIQRFDLNSTVHLRIHYPPMTESFQHEVELVAAIGPHPTEGEQAAYRNLTPEEAGNAVWGYGLGLDMTRRDLQLQLRSGGHPLDLAKGPDEGAVISPLISAGALKENQPGLFRNKERSAEVVCNGRLTLSVNGTIRQDSCISSMILPVDEAISRLSKYVALKPGDLVYSGTPSGIGPVRRGDVIDCSLEGLAALRVTIEK